jgi:epoxide hydrolase-like predicted phosphatase
LLRHFAGTHCGDQENTLNRKARKDFYISLRLGVSAVKILRSKMIRALITDFGGVLVRTRTDRSRREWERKLGWPPNTIEERVFNCDLSIRASHGEMTEDVFWDQLARDFNLAQYQLTGAEFRHEFFADDFLDEELVTFMRGLRPAIKVGLISNAWLGLRSVLQTAFHLDDMFDEIVISAEEKVMKPNERIYRLALDRLGLQPAEAIFLDDMPINVEAANALGMLGVRFQSTEQALRDIRSRLDQHV